MNTLLVIVRPSRKWMGALSFKNCDRRELSRRPIRRTKSAIARTGSTKAGYKHRGGTEPQAPSQSSPATAHNDLPKPASDPHNGPSHPRPAESSSNLLHG